MVEQDRPRGNLGAPGPSWSGAEPRRELERPARPRAMPAAKSVTLGAVDYELASFPRRAGGFAIDSILLYAAVAMLLLVVEPGSTTGQVVVLLFRVAFNWVWNARGWSPGKRVVGLRIVREDGDPPGAGPGFGRSVGALVSDLALGLGYLWAAWDPRNQTWHDKLAGTYVVRVPRERGD